MKLNKVNEQKAKQNALIFIRNFKSNTIVRFGAFLNHLQQIIIIHNYGKFNNFPQLQDLILQYLK